jgi:iron complex outermembrane receptor protein
MRKITLLRSSFWVGAIKWTAMQLILAVLFAVIGYAKSGHSQDVLNREVTLNIKEKKLEYVLNKIQEQTKVMFVFSPKLIQSDRLVTINKSKEKLSVVLDELAGYLNLTYEVAGDKVILKRQLFSKASIGAEATPQALPARITGKVTNTKGEPLPGVSIVIKGKSGGASTNAAGNFTIEADEGDVLVISIIGFKTKEITVGSQQEISIELEETIAELTTVVVGSRSLRPRTNVESPVPVDVISSKDLLATGQIEPTQQIQFTAPSFVSNRQTIADGTDHVDPASLRGLGPDQVLVLVNGKRRYNTALVNINGTVGKGSVGTDLNSIPASAIERIEVLRDGAASQYGSDAIAGVINVVLKKKTGTQVFAHAGQQYAGDGGNLQLGINHGFKLGNKGGILNITGEVRRREPTNRAGEYLGTVFSNNASQDSALIAQNGGWDRKNNMFIGNSKQLNAYGEVNLEVPIASGNTKFYATGMYSYRKGKAAGFYRYPKQTSQVVAQLYPRGFLPYIESTINDRSGIIGFRGKTKNAWNWDASTTYGGNQFKFEVTNSNNASMGAASPTEFDCGKLAFRQSTTNVDFSKDFGSKLNLSSFNVAVGAEMRFDMFKITAGQEESWRNYDPNSGKVGGAQVFPGYQPSNEVDETRSVVSTYVDVESDITEKFLVNVAGRFEHYSDFGNALAGKLALRYKILDALSIRGAISNGFRAPSIHQYYFNNTSTQFQIIGGTLSPSNTLTVRNNSDIAKALGIPDLKEETSVNYSLGITAKPGRVSLTIDAYHIDIKNRILLAGPFRRSNTTVNTVLNNAGISGDVQVVQAFSNIINTRTQGLDVILATSPKVGKGTLDLTLAANFNETKIKKVKGTENIPAVPDSVGNYFFFDRAEQSRVELANPKNKISLSANYQFKKIGALVRVTRFGEVSSWNPDPRLDETYEAKFVTDASISYSIIPQVRVTIGANNIFDVYPDKLKWFRDGKGDKSNIYYSNTSDGRFVYSRNATQFGMNGGYYYINLSASF